MATEYEKARNETIERNKALLASLMAGVDTTLKPRSKPTKRPVSRTKADYGPAMRFSARTSSGGPIEYKELGEDDPLDERSSSDGEPFDDDASDDEDEERTTKTSKGRKRRADPQRKAARLSGHRPDPKIFGEQMGTKPGDWFESRMAASQAGIHAPTVGGMSGHATLGCWSICLSGGYDEDVDEGYAMTFTGCGGRDLTGTKGRLSCSPSNSKVDERADKPKNLRTAPQSSDQTFSNRLNAALKVSAETGKPVRVIRGFKNPSPFAPQTGYRYDGLYVCKRAWIERGLSAGGFDVCRYAMVRLPGQTAIPIHPDRKKEGKRVLQELGFDTTAGVSSSPVKRESAPSMTASTSTTSQEEELRTPADEMREPKFGDKRARRA